MKYIILLLVSVVLGCSGTYDRALKNEGYEPDGLGFIQAVKDNNAKAVGWFLKMPQVHSFADKNGATAVFYAAELQNSQMLNMLMSAGIPVELTDNSKRNPLHYAIEKGCFENVAILLKKGVDPQWEDNFERDALKTLISLRKKENLEIFQLLIEKNININSRDIDKKTPLIMAAEHGYPNYLKMLIKLKAAPLIKDYKGKTALDYAMENYDKKIIDRETFEHLADYTANIKEKI